MCLFIWIEYNCQHQIQPYPKTEIKDQAAHDLLKISINITCCIILEINFNLL